MNGDAGALAGLRVLDAASLYAGPLVATLLADHGAEVVKVEPPGGDVYRRWPAMWAIVGRGKRSITLDLATSEGADELHRILPSFDVIVENLPPAVAARRRLTVADIWATHARAVIVSASGFGRDGPYADRPANGTLGEAMAGLTHLTGAAGGPPTLPDVALGDAVAAAFGAFGAIAGVFGRDRGGAGVHIDLTVFEPILHLLGPALAGYRDGPPPSRQAGDMGRSLRGTFATADGHWVALSASTPRHEEAAGRVAGGEGALRDRVERWIASQPSAAVLDAFVDARVPITPVNDLAALVTDPQVVARGSLRLGETGWTPVATPRIDVQSAGR